LLDISHNQIKEIREIVKLKVNSSLREISIQGNPIFNNKRYIWKFNTIL